MKYMNFICKLLSLSLLLGVLAYYQGIARDRAAVLADNKAAIAEVEAYNAEILRQQMGSTVSYTPGTYQGEGLGFGGPITVAVTVSDTEIKNIEVLSHDDEDPAYYDLAAAVVDEVLQSQSADVDTVSGATFSSVGLLEAVEQALEQAVSQ